MSDTTREGISYETAFADESIYKTPAYKESLQKCHKLVYGLLNYDSRMIKDYWIKEYSDVNNSNPSIDVVRKIIMEHQPLKTTLEVCKETKTNASESKSEKKA